MRELRRWQVTFRCSFCGIDHKLVMIVSDAGTLKQNLALRTEVEGYSCDIVAASIIEPDAK